MWYALRRESVIAHQEIISNDLLPVWTIVHTKRRDTVIAIAHYRLTYNLISDNSSKMSEIVVII